MRKRFSPRRPTCAAQVIAERGITVLAAGLQARATRLFLSQVRAVLRMQSTHDNYRRPHRYLGDGLAHTFLLGASQAIQFTVVEKLIKLCT